MNVALAEHRLQKLQAKLRSDAERGDMAAVDCDVRRIDNVKYRIAIHEWLIRWNSRQYPDFYPIRTDAVSCAAIAQAAHPTPAPYPPQYVPTPGPMATAPTITITIVNAETAGAGVAFAIDGITLSGPRRLAPGPGRGPRLEHHLRRWRIARPAPVSALARCLRVPIDRRGLGAIQASGHALNRRWDPPSAPDSRSKLAPNPRSVTHTNHETAVSMALGRCEVGLGQAIPHDRRSTALVSRRRDPHFNRPSPELSPGAIWSKTKSPR